MSGVDLKKTVHVSEIPVTATRQEVSDKLKEKLGLGEDTRLKIGNFQHNKNPDIPYQWGIFEFPDEETKDKAVQECKFIVFGEDENGKGIQSRVQVNDRDFVKKQIANGEKNICVKKIPDHWDHSDLYDFF